MPVNARSRAIVRRGRQSDVDAILELLKEYGLGREYFEPRYRHDPTYRPELSWIAVLEERVVAHARVFDRTIRLGSGVLRIAGVGNVITALAHRGAGHAGRVRQALVDDATRERYAYSLLWTHVPDLYARYGWRPIRECRIEARVHARVPGGVDISIDADPDLAGLAALYEAANRGRTGPAARTGEDWRAQRTWTKERILVARAGRAVVGYVREREGEILDLAAPGRADVARALLATVARSSPRRAARGRLPPSDIALLAEDERRVADTWALMGRVLDRDAFLVAVEDATGLATRDVEPLLADEARLARLLFHGADDSDAEDVRARFPPRDFVIWEADAF
jgi:predicted N-acetyltransferase YhbS